MTKKSFIIIFSLLMASSIAFSQGLHLGIKGGTDIQKIDGFEINDKFAFGYHLGGYAQIILGSTFSIQPELYYSEVNLDTSNNFSQTYQSIDVSKVKLGYLNIPVLLNIKLAKKLSIQLGPKYGILSSSNLSLKGQAENAIKSGDFSVVAGLQVKISKLRMYGRYQVGLNDISDIGSSQKWKSQSAHIGLALQIF